VSTPVPSIYGGLLDREARTQLEAVSAATTLDSGGGASLLKVFLLAELILTQNLERVVEIGVYRGRLFLPLGKLMALRGHGEIVGIDPYSVDAAVQRDVEREGIDLVAWPTTIDWDGIHDEIVTAMEHWQTGIHARLVRRRSKDAADLFVDSPIDLLHVDGNHDRDAVLDDLERYLPLIRPGGYLVMDDIAWPSIKPIYEELARSHEVVFSLVENGVVLWPEGGVNEFAILRIDAPAASY
jgi:hypothetical protein